MSCPWCKFNKNSCEGVEDACDFKSLPYERAAILVRIREENVKIEGCRKVIESSHDREAQIVAVKDVIDRMQGVKIMVDRLVADFGMTVEQVRESAGMKTKSSVLDSVRMRVMMRSLGGAVPGKERAASASSVGVKRWK